MKYKIILPALALALLVGCAVLEKGSAQPPAQSAPLQSALPAASTLGREEETTLAGDIPAQLHIGEGYSIYIPTEDWTLELDSGDGIPHETWEADAESDAQLTVYHYENVSFMVARDRFVKDADDYAFDSGAATAEEPVYGTEPDGDVCTFLVAEGSHGTTYVVAWEYPAGTEETYGPLLAAMAQTFELTE